MKFEVRKTTRKWLLFAVFGLLSLAAFTRVSSACPASGLDDWLAQIASGQFEAAQKRIVEWQNAQGCECVSAETVCLEITLFDGTKQSVSPAQLGIVISQALAWEGQGRKECDPLSGGDEVGRVARQACLERHARNMDSVTDELSKKLLSKPLTEAAARLSKGVTTTEEPEKATRRMIDPSENSSLAERAAEQSKKLGKEICEMRRQVAEIEQRISNMQRETKFIKTEYYKRLRTQEKMRDDLEKAIEKNESLFRQYAGRDFLAARDCFTE